MRWPGCGRRACGEYSLGDGSAVSGSHHYDKEIYKERNRIERFFNKLKHFRRVATRYDKLLANFMGFVKIAAIAIQLR